MQNTLQSVLKTAYQEGCDAAHMGNPINPYTRLMKKYPNSIDSLVMHYCSEHWDNGFMNAMNTRSRSKKG